jgi:hypothetical protein
MSAALAVQKAIFAGLSASPQIAALIGANRIFDDVPPGVKPPYVVLAAATVRPLGGLEAGGEEHFLTLTAWTPAKGKSELLTLGEAIRNAAQAVLPLEPPHRLVSVEWLETTAGREETSGLHRLEMRFRAFTE